MQAERVEVLRTQNEEIREVCANIAKRIRFFTDNQATPPFSLLLLITAQLETAAFIPDHLRPPDPLDGMTSHGQTRVI